MAIPLNDNIDIKSAKPTDQRYGPYDSLADAKSAIAEIYRYEGLTVGIIIDGEVVEYWWPSEDDVSDDALVVKTPDIDLSSRVANDDLTFTALSVVSNEVTFAYNTKIDSFSFSISADAALLITGSPANGATVRFWVTTDTAGLKLTVPSGSKIKYKSADLEMTFPDSGVFQIIATYNGTNWFFDNALDPFA